MSWLPLLLFFIASSMAEEGNEIHILAEEDTEEGRSCVNCGSGSSSSGGGYYHNGGTTSSSTIGMSDMSALSLGLSSLLSKGSGVSMSMIALPLLGVNIAILVILGILLVHVKKLTSYGEDNDVYHYAAAPAFGGSTYQNYDSGYHKRSTEEARNMGGPSPFSIISRMVFDAIDKYSEIETPSEA